MRVVDLALKDFTQLVRDWKAGLFLIALPIVITLMLGLAFGGSGGQDSRLPVALLDQDGSSLSAGLLDTLQQSDVIRIVISEDADVGDLENRVREEKLAAAVIVPAGYGAGGLTASPIPLTLIADGASAAGAIAQGEVQTAAARLMGAGEAAQLAVRAYTAQASFPSDAARQDFFDAALAQALAAWQDPPLTVAAASGAQGEDSVASASGYAAISPGIMIQFAIAGLIGSAEIVVLERRSRALRRMLTTAISRAEILLGHCLAMCVTIFLQLVILIAFGQLVLGVNYLRAPLAALVMMATTALWTASMGMLIGALAKTDEQVVIFSLVPMFVLSGLGGAWMPLESTGKTFQTIGHLLPSAWAIDGFKNIVLRGLGVGSVLLPAGVLLAYAALFFGLAVWRFRFE